MSLAVNSLWNSIRKFVLLLAVISGIAILSMIVITLADIILRLAGSGIRGAYDAVRLAAVIAIAFSLPYVTAVKGHIAIEFLYHRCSRTGRLVLDTSFRMVSLGLFALLAWRSFLYGLMLFRTHQVMPTLSVPVFWIPCLISLSCILIFIIVLYHMLHPGKEFIKP